MQVSIQQTRCRGESCQVDALGVRTGQCFDCGIGSNGDNTAVANGDRLGDGIAPLADRVRALQRMVTAGLDETAATLTLVRGIGPRVVSVPGRITVSSRAVARVRVVSGIGRRRV